MTTEAKRYSNAPTYSDCVSEKILKEQIPLLFPEATDDEDCNVHRVLSLFSGCGGMDLGFEGHFIANKKSFPPLIRFLSLSNLIPKHSK